MTPKPSQVLEPRDIHVWIIGPVQLKPEAGTSHSLLCADESERAARFKLPGHGPQWAFFRSAMREILGQYTNSPPDELRFGYDNNGKPGLLAPSTKTALEFNLSHSGELALLAITHIAPVGVDIEQAKEFDNRDELVARFFSETEQRAYEALPHPERISAFYHCWTRKEALIKALGLGLSAPLDAFDVSLTPSSTWQVAHTRPPLPQDLAFPLLQIDPAPDYRAAVALCTADFWQPEPPTVKIFQHVPA